MTASSWIALGGLVLTILGCTGAIVGAVAKLSFTLGEMAKTIKGHSRLLAMVPCLKPHCEFSSEEEK